jgi:heat shock protein HspQ
MLGKLKYLFAKPQETTLPEDRARNRQPDTHQGLPPQPDIREAKYKIGQVVHHRLFDFRGVIFDVDPEYANSQEWYEAIPEDMRPAREQPYYHLFAENDKSHYTAYVSEQNLVPDESETLIKNPDIDEVFTVTQTGNYKLRRELSN